MWMIGCRDGSDLNSSNCNVRRLRPLIPRPATNPTSNSYFTLNQQNAEPLALFAQLGNARDKAACFGTQPGQLVSSRWNPTPKQLETLVDIYKQGTRNPTADQIQHITYQLRKFGKIEGKNVFYWFQNHKARERQKRRRRIEAGERELVESSDKQLSESHAQGTSSSGVPTKSTISAKEFVSVSRSTPESARDRQDHLSQCDNPAHEQDQQGHATWKLVHSSAPRYHHFSNVVSPSSSTTDHLKQVSDKYNAAMDEDKLGELQTLELFPLHSDHKVHDEKESHVGATLPTSLGSTPFQFFHFLPLKN